MILASGRAHATGRHHVIALFGLGLIGSALQHELRQRLIAANDLLPFGWGPAAPFALQSAAIEHAVARQATNLDIAGQQSLFDCVWCAGVGGFATPAEAFETERRAFGAVLDFARRLATRLPDSEHTFHLLSSAGGLFEGRRHVSGSTRPEPLRPYGRIKLEQEALTRDLPGRINTQIYRPTSVYGFAPRGRTGLVAALAGDAIRRRTTRIFGNPNTIRDYVFADDIARFIADAVIYRAPSATHLLASGKPTSVLEVVRHVEARMQRSLYVQFDTTPSNARDMSVEHGSLPPSLRATPLQIGIATTADRVMRHMTGPAPSGG